MIKLSFQRFLHPELGILYRFFRTSFIEAVGRIAVHVHLAHIADYSGLLEFLHQGERCLAVNRRKDQSSCRSAFSHAFGKQAVCLFGIGRIGEFAFLGECPVLKPVQKFLIHSHSPVGKLGGVGMKIAHSRHDQRIGKFLHRQAPVFLRQFAENSLADSVFRNHIAVIQRLDFPEHRCMTDITFQYQTIIHNGISRTLQKAGSSTQIVPSVPLFSLLFCPPCAACGERNACFFIQSGKIPV